MKRIAALFAVCGIAFFAFAESASKVDDIIAEAAGLAEKGAWEEAAIKAAEADSIDADDPSKLAMALNASLNYYAKASVIPVADNRKIRLNSLFSDHAVLQRDMPIPIWGHVEPNCFITIGLGGTWLTAKANEFGGFRVVFPKMEAGGPYVIEAYCNGHSFKAEDIYVGEVWVAGGQSNMEMPLTGYGNPVPKEDYAALHSKRPVRMLKVKQCNDVTMNEDCGSSWMTTWEGNEKTWSAAASFFAYDVANKLDCPVGIVLCAYSGSRAETWLSFDALYNLASTRNDLEKYEYGYRQQMVVDDNKPYSSARFGITAPAYTSIMKDLERNFPDVDLDQPPEGREKVDFDDSGWKKVEVPRHWYETLGQANGVAWFRKTIHIPEKWAGKELVLSLGAIDKQDKTYFNGTLVGETGKGWEHKYWGTKRVYNVPANLVKPGKAVIAVRVFSMADGSGFFGPANEMTLSCEGESIGLAGNDWAAKITVNINQREGASRAYRHQPHFMADSMLSTIIPYAIRGVIWYQGCSNSGRANYGEVMKALITDWRNRWNKPAMPFIQVLLAGFEPGRGYEDVRQRQIESARATGSWFVSAIDGGHANIHPPYKKMVGERLAGKALKEVYRLEGIQSDYPEFKSMSSTNGIVTISFENAAGLHANGGVVAGFEVCDGGKCFPVSAELDGDQIKVKLPEGLSNAKRIRYAWKPNPKEANLFNGGNLPALPFDKPIIIGDK